jgi:hypothetical protein
LIDIGCGTQPYRSIAAPYLTRYVGLEVILSLVEI